MTVAQLLDLEQKCERTVSVVPFAVSLLISPLLHLKLDQSLSFYIIQIQELKTRHTIQCNFPLEFLFLLLHILKQLYKKASCLQETKPKTISIKYVCCGTLSGISTQTPVRVEEKRCHQYTEARTPESFPCQVQFVFSFYTLKPQVGQSRKQDLREVYLAVNRLLRAMTHCFNYLFR